MKRDNYYSLDRLSSDENAWLGRNSREITYSDYALSSSSPSSFYNCDIVLGVHTACVAAESETVQHSSDIVGFCFLSSNAVEYRCDIAITEKPKNRRETKSDGFARRNGRAAEAPGRDDIEIFDSIRSIGPHVECTGTDKLKSNRADKSVKRTRENTKTIGTTSIISRKENRQKRLLPVLNRY